MYFAYQGRVIEPYPWCCVLEFIEHNAGEYNAGGRRDLGRYEDGGPMAYGEFRFREFPGLRELRLGYVPCRSCAERLVNAAGRSRA
jgi:hypothetical protein